MYDYMKALHLRFYREPECAELRQEIDEARETLRARLSREDREKLLRGIVRACDKRPVTAEQLDGVVDRIEQTYLNRLVREVSSEELGEAVLLELKKLDKVAYIRFASVYREFQDINSFMDELRAILEEKEQEELEK